MKGKKFGRCRQERNLQTRQKPKFGKGKRRGRQVQVEMVQVFGGRQAVEFNPAAISFFDFAPSFKPTRKSPIAPLINSTHSTVHLTP